MSTLLTQYVTYADLGTLITNSALQKGTRYQIYDRADLGIILTAISANEISLHGDGGFYNPDFQDVGDYSGVAVITGIAAGSRLGILSDWTAIPAVGSIVIWNGLHYQLVTLVGFDGTPPDTNPAYTVLPKPTPGMGIGASDVGYIEEWDTIEFDFANDWLQYRADKRGNTFAYSKATDDIIFGLGYSAIIDFQWGNTTKCFGNNISQSSISNLNTPGSIFGNTLNSGSAITGNILDPDASISGNLLSGGSLIQINTLITGSFINTNTLTGAANFTLNTLIGGSSIIYNTLESGASIVSNQLDEISYIQANILESGSTITENSLIGNSGIDQNTLQGSSVIRSNILSVTASSPATITNNLFSLNAGIENKTIDPGVIFQKNEVINKAINAIETYSATIENKGTDNTTSNFEATIDITGLTILDITADNIYCGIINITSSNATENIDEITVANTPSVPFTLRPASGLVLTVTGTAVASATTDDIVLPTATIVLDGTNGDWLQLESNGTYSRQLAAETYI
jgi:hypothetical protein